MLGSPASDRYGSNCQMVIKRNENLHSLVLYELGIKQFEPVEMWYRGRKSGGTRTIVLRECGRNEYVTRSVSLDTAL